MSKQAKKVEETVSYRYMGIITFFSKACQPAWVIYDNYTNLQVAQKYLYCILPQAVHTVTTNIDHGKLFKSKLFIFSSLDQNILNCAPINKKAIGTHVVLFNMVNFVIVQNYNGCNHQTVLKPFLVLRPVYAV